jgi:hypothetical protein
MMNRPILPPTRHNSDIAFASGIEPRSGGTLAMVFRSDIVNDMEWRIKLRIGQYSRQTIGSQSTMELGGEVWFLEAEDTS